MSVMTPVEKQADTDKKHVRDVFSLVRAGAEDGMATLELTLMELALAKLHIHRDELRKAGERAVAEEQKKLSKLYRAVAKTALRTGDYSAALGLVSKDISSTEARGKQWIESHTRRGGRESISGYWRSLREGETQTKETKAKIEELKRDEREKRKRTEQAGFTGLESGFRDKPVTPTNKEIAQFTISELDGVAEKFYETVHNDTYQDAMNAYLSEESFGSGISAAAAFFTNPGNKFQFAAKAIAEFGPFTGSRLAYNYFRFGGYDVPMKVKDGQIYTEMGDALPVPESAEKTRNWAIETLMERLPGEGADEQGAEPPSEGFIIDGDGNVLVHAVGRGNDHFIPFNAKHLRELRKTEGVEYVRRRMFGGPTDEDIRAAMALGADRVTIISNGGKFSFGLSERSHGFKMEHFQVAMRYQEMLNENLGSLDFDAYSTTLDSLASEFPLHFFKLHSEPGEWATDDDRIQPRTRFMDGLREMFNALGGSEADLMGKNKFTPETQRNLLPGKRDKESIDDYVARLQQSGVRNADIANRLDRYYTAQGTSLANVKRFRHLREGAQTPKQQRSMVGPVHTRYQDPVQQRGKQKQDQKHRQQQQQRNRPQQQRAKPVAPPEIDLTLDEVGRDRMQTILGITDPKPSPGNIRRASEIIERANKASDDEWSKMSGDEFWDIINVFDNDDIDFG